MLSWQYSEIYTCISAYLWTYSVKGNLWWCLHGSCNLSFCFSGTSHSNGKTPGFHHLSYMEFSACPIWLLKKTVRLSSKGGCACIPPVSWVCFYRIVYYQYTLHGQVSISIFTNQLWMGLFALVFLDNLSGDSLSDMHFLGKQFLYFWLMLGLRVWAFP